MVRDKPFIIKVGESRIRTIHTPTHSGSPSHLMLQSIDTRCRGSNPGSLSLRADTLKRCIDYGDQTRGGYRTHGSSLNETSSIPKPHRLFLLLLLFMSSGTVVCQYRYVCLFVCSSIMVLTVCLSSNVTVPLLKIIYL